jgi:flagellar hook assembly protein FlgD
MDPIGRIDQGLIDRAVQETAVGGTGDNSFDGDMFMQMLLVQLQNQDPLAPTDNSEIMKVQATLSEVEQSLRQTDALESVKNTVDIGLTDISITLANINNTLTQLVANQNGDSGENSGGKS